jgi:hypothetical protein
MARDDEEHPQAEKQTLKGPAGNFTLEETTRGDISNE